MPSIRLFTAFLLLVSTLAKAQISINEFLASNNLINQDPDFQSFADWVELYNAGSSDVDLGGWWLSDDADLPEKWVFPAGTTLPANGFLLIWADGENTGLHTNFKLSADGEKLILSDASGLEQDKISFLPQLSNVSQGRAVDGSGNWGFYTSPTPGASNASSIFFTDYLKTIPHFTAAGGFFQSAPTVDVQNLGSIGVVHFTVDGSVPTANSPIFDQPVTLASNTVVKARIVAPNQIPGPVVTNTYFIGENFQERGLAVLSLSGNPDDFFGQDSGILVQDFKPLWEIPVHLEFYENDGLLGFHHDAGASVGGENSWILPQKMLNISSRNQYGGGHIEYQVFPDNPRTRFEDIILRTSGNDWSNTLFRDGMMQGNAGSTADLDIQAIRPVSTFINGVYYGIYNLREKQDKEYAEIYHEIPSDSLDYIENDGEVKEGNDQAYQQMVAMLNAGLQSDSAFQQFSTLCDTRNFTDYIIAEIFSANTSWGHNIALFRKRNPQSKWRWLLHDFDRGFNLSEVSGTGMNWATATDGPSWSNGPFATLFLRKMLENNAYKASFISRFADNLFVTWNPLWINPRIERHANWIRNEVPYHVGEWAGTTSSYGDGIPSVQYWENEVAELKDFAQQRNAFMVNDLVQFFGLPGASTLNVQVSNPAHGQVRLDEMPALTTYPWTGKYFQQLPFTLTAEPRPGFNFIRWEKTIDSTTTLLPAGSTWKYYDAATPVPNGWQLDGFDDGSWSTGLAQLGYGDGDEVTTLEFGADPNNKTISYYFRQTFDVTDPSVLSALTLRMIVDDGAVLYLNGQEVWRQNMPSGSILSDTPASSTVGAPGENAWLEHIIPANLLLPGQNILAVEVHQAAANSSDLSFDLEIGGTIAGLQQILSANPVLQTSIDSPGPLTLRAVFESTGACGILPDTIRQNMTLTQACSPYTAVRDVVVLPTVSLTMEPGVVVNFPEKASLWVLGDLQIKGSANNPVKLQGLTGAAPWAGVFLKNTSAKSRLSYLIMENASAGVHRVYFPAAISAYFAEIEMDHLDLTQVTDNPIFARFSDLSLSHSNIRSVVTGDGINVKNGIGRVENCNFSGLGALFPDMDAIDFDGVSDGIVRNNIIHDFRGDNCDGLDIGEQCHNLQIEGNFIYHCFDKGISVGQQSSVSIVNNTIAYTAIGIALKDQSPANIEHCTLFGNQSGISAYEKNPGSLGGNGVVSNCIIANAAFDVFYADSLSSLSWFNCLSDTDSLSEPGNLNADPRFINPSFYDFHLMPGSPAMGAGSAGSDLGATTLPIYSGEPQLMVSEILYNDTLSVYGEFLEIHNAGSQAIDLSGYTLFGALDFVFPTGATIEAGAYVVVARDIANFPANVPYPLYEWTDGKLADEGEKILMYDANGLLVDFVRYNNHAPWPEGNTMYGKSLELVSPLLDNHLASSWKPSGLLDGSPGEAGNQVSTNTPESLGLLVYPNPAGDKVQIRLEQKEEQDVLVQVCDLNGRLVYSERWVHQNGSLEKQLNLKAIQNGVWVVRVQDERGNLLGWSKLVVFRP